jgi:aminoglycoside phosphotransferase (APT) family kinase protein
VNTLDADLVRCLLHRQFPEIEAARIDYLNEGCDSIAFEVDGGLVFRFPKRAEVENQMAVERAVLETLAAAKPPVAIPCIQYEGQRSSGFGFRFAGYAKIPGQPAIGADLSFSQLLGLAPAIGSFLGWLHAVPLDSVAHINLETLRMSSLLDEMRGEALEAFPRIMAAGGQAPFEQWRVWIRESNVHRDGAESPMVLLHNDIAADHVLVNLTGDGLTGVIDWSDTAVGDRAADFAGVYHWGGQRLMDAVLNEYQGPVEPGVHERARFLAVCRGALDVSFGVERHRPEYIEAGLKALSLNAGG